MATKLIPDPATKSNNYHLTGTTDDISIAFFVYVPHLKAGNIIEFREGHAADLMINDAIVFYGGRKGKCTITKVDAEGFEATFSTSIYF